MNIYIRICLLVLAVISGAVVLAASVKFRGFKTEVTGLKAFMLEKYFYIGVGFSRTFKVRHTSGIKRKRLLSEIYPQDEVVKINNSAEAAPVTYICMFTPLIFSVGAFFENLAVMICLVGLLVFLCGYFDIRLSEKIKKRHAEILHEYASVLTKISLLVNAGITAADAFERVAMSGTGLFCKEMQRTVSEISNGMSYDTALDNLALRGGCKEIKKFVSLYKQNLVKGGAEFPFLLSEMADMAWSERKTRAKLAGSSASQKLLGPIMLMFSGILIMVIVPAFKGLL